jgi:hypothetical protein
VAEVQLRTAERSGRADAGVLSRLAQALGGSFDDLLSGRQFWAAPALAFKSASAFFEPSILRARIAALAAAANTYQGLATFLDIPDLWRQVGSQLGPRGVSHDVVAQAEEGARDIRNRLHAGDQPIASIRAFASRLGVVSFLADFGEEAIDGLMWKEAGTAAPRIGANVAARAGLITALRMTLAHELCHALFDRPKAGYDGLAERRTDDAVGREQRANAFAAYLLAPRGAVLATLGQLGWKHHDIPTPQQLLSLSRHFGMGVEALAYHLVNCGVWPRDQAQRYQMSTPPASGEDNRELNCSNAERAVPLERRGVVLDLATQALAQQKISVGRWREIVDVPLHADWPLILAERHVVA